MKCPVCEKEMNRVERIFYSGKVYNLIGWKYFCIGSNSDGGTYHTTGVETSATATEKVEFLGGVSK